MEDNTKYSLPVDRELQNINEEFNNFLHRVTEVTGIVNNLASSDPIKQNIGLLEADRIVNNSKSEIIENLDENELILNVKSNRTVLNEKALHKKDDANQDTMDPEVFMEEMSKDADKRYKDKLVRTERMETFKKRATKAFRCGEYENALVNYNNAIEQIKDSPLLYNNRALTQIKLSRYDNALEDLKLALRLNENCLRSLILMARCYKELHKTKMFNETVQEAKEKNPEQIDWIDEAIGAM